MSSPFAGEHAAMILFHVVYSQKPNDNHAAYGSERDERPTVGKLEKVAAGGGGKLEAHVWSSAGAGRQLREIDAALSSVAAADVKPRAWGLHRPRTRDHSRRGRWHLTPPALSLPQRPAIAVSSASMRTGTVLALLIVALTGCDYYDLVDAYWCPNPDKAHKDANGQPDPCHKHDPAAADGGLPDDGGSPEDAGEPCPDHGRCVPAPTETWRGPVLLWKGLEADAPPCPASADYQAYIGYADLDAPTTCGACKCNAPIGSCALPATMTAAAGSCPGNGPGVVHTSFDPPTKWDGSCTAANSVPAGKLCGGAPCVQSVTMAPLMMTQGGCVPIEPVNVQAPPAWKTFARACGSDVYPMRCGPEGALCAPRASGPEFRTCVFDKGNPLKVICPSAYPDRSVFYHGFVDTRMCDPCTCGSPEGSTCTGSIGLFSDTACGSPLGLPTFPVDATGPACFDIKPAGPALGSKTASDPIFTPGTCTASGGEPTGEVAVDPELAMIFCCLKTP